MKPKPLFNAMSATLGAIPVLTDEEWAEHDARIERDKRAEREADAAKNAKAKIAEYQARGFPLRAITAALAADETQAALERIEKWDPTDLSMFVLSGPAGCGKTVAAVWWAMQRSHAPMFLRSTTLAASSRYANEERKAWIGAGALVLDDLGTEYADAKGNYQVDLDELFDVFYGDRKPLVVTTNCDKAEFQTRYGVRVYDRLRECGAWFSVKADSLRGKR